MILMYDSNEFPAEISSRIVGFEQKTSEKKRSNLEARIQCFYLVVNYTWLSLETKSIDYRIPKTSSFPQVPLIFPTFSTETVPYIST